MKIDRKSHVTFFQEEIFALQEQVKSYWLSYALNLYEQGELFIGRFAGVDPKRGTLFLNHKSGKTPRLNQVYEGFTLKPSTPTPNNWARLTYIDLKKEFEKNTSEVKAQFMQTSQNIGETTVGYSGAELDLTQDLKIDTPIVIGLKTPPLEYLYRLKKLVDSASPESQEGQILFRDYTNTEWHPKSLSSQQNIPETIIHSLNEHKEVIIQGPPGTGKTFLVSELCSHFLKEGKSVAVTSQSNQALMELATKPQLSEWVSKRKVCKTALTNEEKARLSGLVHADKPSAGEGELLLSTYFKLSELLNNNTYRQSFDILIIEEASQAFLATIAGFKGLSSKLILVGDPMQLPPISLQRNPQRIHEQIELIINGLETYAFNSQPPSYRLTETYRLNPRATKFTGLFYEDSLVSKNIKKTQLNLSSKYSNLFDENGGPSYYALPLTGKGKSPINAITFISELIVDLQARNPELEIAVLAPFRETVRKLQESIFRKINSNQHLTIETIDRIQGLTCDVTIFLIPSDNHGFGMNKNRFNVATSRATQHTLIISDTHFKDITPGVGKVKDFWRKMVQ